jgi:hypothetical protein
MNRTFNEPGTTQGIYGIGEDHEVKVNARHELAGNIILVHGVNDVGTAYEAVEQGLCEGLTGRLDRGCTAARYRMPTEADMKKVEDDPDAIYFRRQLSEDTYTPVIPFYWGFREQPSLASKCNGQYVDRHGNRLDKDLSKGGGPFANATNSIPDMWNLGIGLPLWFQEIGGDALRPVRYTPGRMYMVLAAMRLAALISIIRDRAPDDVVSVVGHSQGCLVTLLAQAFLLDKGLRPADTLILTHPPYSLEDGPDMVWDIARGLSGKNNTDPVMEPHYRFIKSHQTFGARLDTLINIVKGVGEAGMAQSGKLAFTSLGDPDKNGMTGPKWRAAADRDNRGKVYLYFCPEDMTVALGGVKGIGWQGIPDFMRGKRVTGRGHDGTATQGSTAYVERQPLRELGERFYQRVFTKKLRPDPAGGEQVLVGLPPHDFPLRLQGEDDHAHVSTNNRSSRSHLPVTEWPPRTSAKPDDKAARNGIRVINAEPLQKPVIADLGTSVEIRASTPAAGTAKVHANDADGPLERVDPLDADIAVSSDKGIGRTWLYIADSTAGHWDSSHGETDDNPAPHAWPGLVQKANNNIQKIAARLNQGKRADEEKYDVRRVFLCFNNDPQVGPSTGYLVEHIELIDQARLRWRNSLSPKSFHGAIIGSVANHRDVTAFDVGIGGGRAVSDPEFYRYLCAVADWKLKIMHGEDNGRPGILVWDKFEANFGLFWKAEKDWCKEIIFENSRYYTSGSLPDFLPSIIRRPSMIVCETVDGMNGRIK